MLRVRQGALSRVRGAAKTAAIRTVTRTYTLVQDMENPCACTLRRLKVIQETVQHIGYASSEVSLHDAAIVRWAAALVVCCAAAWLSTCGVATVALQMGYVTGLGKDARPAETPVVGGRPYAIGVGRRCVLSGAMRYRN